MKKLRKIDFNQFRKFAIKNTFQKEIKFNRWSAGSTIAFAWRKGW